MNKADVGLVVLRRRIGSVDSLHLKLYRDGTLVRMGAGGIPAIPIGVVSMAPDKQLFHKLMSEVPFQLTETEMDYQDPQIGHPLEYGLEFHGLSQNGQTGENAIWGEYTQIRFQLDLHTKHRSKLLAITDKLILDAIGISNDWYFDGLIKAIFDKHSHTLPRQTLTTSPDEGDELRPHLATFFAQMLKSPRKWNFMEFPKDKVYRDQAGKPFQLIFRIDDGKFSYSFSPL